MPNAHAKRIVDCSGLVIAPGFIDMLGHSEMDLLADPRALSKLYQGITSEITGEGGSVAPRIHRPNDKPRSGGVKEDWTTLDGYFKRLEAVKPALNLGTYVGAGGLRSMIVGSENRPATSDELKKMEALVGQAMDQGAMGVSTALEYPPGAFAPTEELIELSKVAALRGGIYASHIRNEGDDVLRAVDEILRIGREAHIPVEIFHIKIMGKDNWGLMKEVVSKVEKARAEGVDATADMYPYVAARTGLGACLPPQIFSDVGEAIEKNLQDPAVRENLKQELSGKPKDWENLYGESGPEGILFESLPNLALKKYEGMTLAQAAKERGQEPLDALLDILSATRGGGSAYYFAMSEDDLRTALIQPWVSFGQDAHARSKIENAHPRAYGTFARVLANYVRKEGLLSLEAAIRKMTSLAAQRVSLKDRGLLKPGFFADVAVFDLKTIQDRASFGTPAQFATGMRYVFVNGVLELDGGAPTRQRGGRPLRGPGYKGQPVK
jgi:dihydroorotase/N-acyl-D-amino-acid deacylase